MKHPSTKPTVCLRAQAESDLPHISLAPLAAAEVPPAAAPRPLPRRWGCGQERGAGRSGAGSIHPTVGAGKWCWLSPLCHLADQGPPVKCWYLTSCSAMGLQGRSPDTALGKRDCKGQGTPLCISHLHQGGLGIGAGGDVKDTARPWLAAWIMQNLSGSFSLPRRINI